MSRTAGLHQRQKSKRQNRSAGPLLDKAVLIIAFVEPLTTIGQIYQLWLHKDPLGNSLFSWGFFMFSGCLWLAYGIKLRNKPLIVSSILWISTEAIVILQILYYSHLL